MIKVRRCDAVNCLNHKNGACTCEKIRLDHKGRCKEWTLAEIEMKRHTDILTTAREKA